VTGTDVAIVIGALGTFVTSLASVLVSVRNSFKLDEVHKSTDGKMDMLLKVSGAAEKAKGIQEGIEIEKRNGSKT